MVKSTEMEKLELVFTMKTLKVSLQGQVAAGAVTSKPLDPASLRAFLEDSQECRQYMTAWNTTNLMKIKATLEAYLNTQYPSYNFDNLHLEWSNGTDLLSLKS